jgi:hypothetical protein
MVDSQPDGSDGDAVLPDPYKIVSIDSVAAPNGAVGSDWHRYEICQGHNHITGFRSGDIENVTLAVERIVHRLNDRRRHQRGRVHVVLQSKSTRRSE